MFKTALFVFLLSQTVFAADPAMQEKTQSKSQADVQRTEEKNTAMGFIDFEKTCPLTEVIGLAEKIAADSNFASVAVSMTGKTDHGIYIRYKLNDNISTTSELTKSLKAERAKMSKGCSNGHSSFSGLVYIIK